jgi:[ribosomal protein S5]-alanine N-acetyltransferase
MTAAQHPLSFRPIDLDADLESAVRFRRDSFVCSFGDDRRFDEVQYLGFLRAKRTRDPWLAVHVFQGSQLVGQMEFDSYKPAPWIGYVNLYYLAPEQRGLGLATQLDAYASDYLRKSGFANAHLSVSPQNARALRFYAHHGWSDAGARPGDVRLMHKELVAPALRVPTLETEQLWLRSVSDLDIPALERHFVDYEVVRFLSRRVPWPYPEGGVRAHLGRLAATPKGARFSWGIFHKEAPLECIGSIDLFQPGIPHHRGFWLGRNFWGRGYMSEAAAAVTDYAFTELGFAELVLANAAGNQRSRRIKEKSGARLLGLTPGEYVDPSLTQQEQWSLTREAWQERRNKSAGRAKYESA